MSLCEPFIRRPVATSMFMAAVAFLGIAAFPFLPVASLPQIDFPTIQVTAFLSGASAETMAASVAAPLERQFSQIAGITQLTSLSTLGVTEVDVQFDLNRNIDSAAQDIQAAITAAGKTLPQTLTLPPTYRKLNPTDPPILILSASSETIPLPVVQENADNFLIPAISEVPGVARIAIGGDQRPSIRIQVDPAKLAANGLTLEDVRNTVVNATTYAAKGTINVAKTSFTISTNDQITEAPPFDDIILAYRGGAPIRLRDVGQAVAEAADRNIAAHQNNNRGILLNIYKQPGVNVVETVDRIKAELPRLTANVPPAMKVDVVLDRTVMIRASVREVELTLAVTIVLVVLIILLFLRNFWATLIPSITVPLALLGSFAAMYLLNFSLDNISLMALTIAIGFVVDDAIVVVENVYRHIENGETPLAAALKGSREIAFTVLSISFSLVTVFIPLVLMGGIVGRLFREFALAVTASVAVSCLVSLTLAPMLCARCMKRQSSQHGRLGAMLEAGFTATLSFYRHTLDAVLRHQTATLGVFFLTLALTVYLAFHIPKGFLPIEDTGIIQGLAEAAQETSPAEMMRLQVVLGDLVMRDPDVLSINAATGSTDTPATANTSRFFIVLKPRERRKATASQIIDRLRPQLARVQGANIFMQVPQDINVGGRAGRGTFQYTLQAVNVATLIEWSQRMLDKMRTLPELADVSSDLLANAPQLNITINRDQASRFGISPQLIDDTLNDAYGQRQVTQYLTQLNAYPIVLEILPELQTTLASLDRLYVRSPLTATAVPLSTLVAVDASKVGPLSVTHQGQFPSVTLGFNLRPGIALGQAVDAILRAAQDIRLPGPVVATFQGNAQAFQASLANMPALILAALIFVYMILGVLYESYIHPLTILSTLPSAGVGALLALQFGHMDLSVIGVIGIILLIGIVKKNGIMLVDFAITAEREQRLEPIAAIRQACLLRFRPILMTTAAALLAGLPLALGSGVGSETRQPLGYAMVGGLALSQLLTLYTTPVVYLYLGRLQAWLKSGGTESGAAAEKIHVVAAE